MTKSKENSDLNSKNLDKMFKEISSSSHQAFLIETDSREEVFSFFKEELSSLKNKLDKELDKNLFLSLQVFDIAKAKEILSFGKLIFNEPYFIVISFYSINREAQNSLLKFLEETPNNLKIVIISHTGAKILNTIYSRLYRLGYIKNQNNVEKVSDNDYKALAKIFLETKNISRIKLPEIIELLEKKDEYALNFEDKERSDREAVELFLLALYEEVFILFKIEKKESQNISKNNIKDLENNLNKINEFLKYAKNNSSSGKTIIEYLALSLPHKSI